MKLTMCIIFLVLKLLFFCSPTHAKLSTARPDRVFPIEETPSECPEVIDMIEKCEEKHIQCKSHNPTGSSCYQLFYSCTMNSTVLIDRHCQKFVERAIQRKTPLFFEWEKAIDQLMKECNYTEHRAGNDTNFDEAFKVVIVYEIQSWDDCSEAQSIFESRLVALDVKVSFGFSIPYDRFRCGWQLGNIGKVSNRRWMSESCDPTVAEDLNHCCAQHLNCYSEQSGLKVCDEKFLACNKKVLKRSRPSGSCEAYVKKNEAVMKMSRSVYDWFNGAEIATIIRQFDGNFHKPGGFREQPIDSSMLLEVFRLDPSRDLNPSISKAYENVLNAGWSKRFILDSCALLFELNRRYESEQTSLRKLNVCLQEISGKSKELEDAIKEFDKVTTPLIANDEKTLTVEKLEKVLSEKSCSYWIVALEAVFFVIPVLFLLAKWGYETFCRPEQQSSEGAVRMTLLPTTENGQSEDVENGVVGDAVEGQRSAD